MHIVITPDHLLNRGYQRQILGTQDLYQRVVHTDQGAEAFKLEWYYYPQYQHPYQWAFRACLYRKDGTTLVIDLGMWKLNNTVGAVERYYLDLYRTLNCVPLTDAVIAS